MSQLAPIFAAIGLVCLLLLYWVYDGYGRFLAVLVRLRPKTPAMMSPDEDLPSTVVMLTVHDEARVIRARIENLLELVYPSDRLRILVVSDRSTDGTDEIVREMAGADSRVELLPVPDSNGKSDAQNRAISQIDEEIVVFTDAGTSFHPECVRAMNRRFADERVGMVDAELGFELGDSSVSRGQGWYWIYERRLRRLESDLGMLAVGSGACMAVKRGLLSPLSDVVGEDCQIPLMVVDRGAVVVQEPLARATDTMPSEPGAELRTRARMTARNLIGTFAMPHLLLPFRRPGVAFGLWSHKVLRWLSPVWLSGAILGLGVAGLGGGVWTVAATLPALVVLLSLLGWVGDRLGLRIPLAGSMWTFMLANVGFGWGLAKALVGARITRYSSS